MNYSAVLFDFDYTLADSSRGIVICFQQVLHRNGYTQVSDEEIKRTIGKTLEDSFSLLTGVSDQEQLINWRKQYGKEADKYMSENTLLFPDTLEVLNKLKQRNVRIGIISTKYRFRILELLGRYFPEEWLDVIIGGEDVTLHKPDPEGLNKAIGFLHLEPIQILYVGDSVIDAETAASAGVDFVGITTGMTTRNELEYFPHVKIISCLSELLIIKELIPEK